MINKMILIGLFSGCGLIAYAQEYWLQPTKFHYQPGDILRIGFATGEGFDGSLWDVQKNHVEMLRWYSNSDVKDFSSDAKRTNTRVLQLEQAKIGTHMVVLQSTQDAKDWTEDLWKEYAENNGLEQVLDAIKQPESHQSVKERSVRYLKILVQNGELLDDTYKQKTGLKIEIVPESNPYRLSPGDHLRCRIFFDGKPSPHTLVKVWSRLNRTTFLQNIYTEDDGAINFPLSTKGKWMVSTQRTIPRRAGEWETSWGSLVFGVE